MVHTHPLLTIPSVAVTHLHNGEEAPLAQDVPLTISVMEVPTTATSSDLPPSYGDAVNRPASPDSYLVIQLSELLELPLTALTKIVSQHPNSYVIPIANEDPLDGGAAVDDKGGRGKGKQESRESISFVRITLDSSKVDPEDKDTLDAILASWTTFSGGPGEEYKRDTKDTGKDVMESKDQKHGHLALVDEHTGQVVGDLSSIKLEEEPDLLSASEMEKDPIAAKEPVVIQLPEQVDGNQQQQPQAAIVSRLSHVRSQYGQSGSKLISGAEWISRGILYGSEAASNLLSGVAKSYTTRNAPTDSPLVFTPRTRKQVQTVQNVTKSAVAVSGKAAHYIGGAAAFLGDRIGKTTGIQESNARGQPQGLVNKSLVAFNTVFDALEHGGKHLLQSASTSTNSLVAHRYGEEAGQMAQAVTGTIQGVALVYIDIRGVTRKAILKSMGKAAIKGRMADGRSVVLATDGELTAIKASTEASTASPVASGSDNKASGGPRPSVWSKFK